MKIIICLLLIFAPLLPLYSSPNKSLEKIVLQLKWKHQFQFAGFYAAVEKGYYKKVGLKVTLKDFKHGMHVINEVISGRSQYGIYSPTIMLARQQKKPVVVTTVILQHSPYIIITARSSRIFSPQDLTGKTIMTSIYNHEMISMLTHEGVKRNSYKIVPMKDFDYSSLMNGEVDAQSAYLTDAPFILKKKGFAYHIIRPINYGIDFYGDCIFTSENEIKNHPKRVQAFLKASILGWKYAMEHPREIVNVIRNNYGCKKSVKELLAEAESMRKLMLPKLVEIGHMNLGRWRHIEKVFKRMGLLKNSFSIDGFLYDPTPPPGWFKKNYVILLILTGLFLIISFLLYFFNRRLNLKVKQRTKELSLSEKQFRSLFENPFQLSGLLSPDGKIKLVNKAALSMIGKIAADMVGQYFWEMPWWSHSEESKQKVKKAVEDAGKKIFTRFETIIYDTEGKLCNIDFSIKPVLDNKDTVIALLPESRDITTSRQAALNLRKEKIFKESIINSLPGTFFVYDKNGEIIERNTYYETVLGYSKEKLKTMRPTDFFPAQDKAKIIEAINTVFTSGEIQFETNMLHTNGTSIPFLFTAKRIEIDGKEYIIGHGIDISRRKKVERELQQAQKLEAIGTLAGGIAHDFNNILSGIFGYLELSLINKGPSVEIYLHETMKLAERAKELVQQILTFSRKDEEQQKMIPLQIATIINDSYKLLRSSIPTTIEIKTEITSTAPVLANPTRIHQIVMNLCTNAYHAMEESGGQLTIMLEDCLITSIDLQDQLNLKPGDYVKLSISDTGCGMNKKIKEKIFEPYFTTKESGKGTGLGLAIVHGIIKNMKGNIFVYSEPGEGTAFHIYLPVISDDSSKIHSNKTEYKLQGGNEHIMLVDDEESIVSSSKKILENYGYQISSFVDSLKALEEFKLHPQDFDLLISDKTMPKMDGLILSENILNIRSDIPIIICSGFNIVHNKENDTVGRISKYINKPITLYELLTSVREVLDN